MTSAPKLSPSRVKVRQHCTSLFEAVTPQTRLAEAAMGVLSDAGWATRFGEDGLRVPRPCVE